jgi:hypothetical protein
LAALATVLQDPLPGKWAERIRRCEACPLIGLNAAGLPVLIPARCGHRLCPACQRGRSIRLARTIATALEKWSAVRFSTLTLAATSEPLMDQVSRLQAAFRELRRTVLWRKHVRGSVWTIQVTWNATTSRWHPHLHLLLNGSYLPQPQLKKAWLKVTGDSYIVDIRAVHDRRQASRYIASYVAKAAELAGWPPERILEYARALHAKRTFGTTGKLWGSEAALFAKQVRPKVCGILIAIPKLLRQAEASNPRAIAVIGIARRIGGAWPHFLRRPPPEAGDPPITAADYEELVRLCKMLNLEP